MTRAPVSSGAIRAAKVKIIAIVTFLAITENARALKS
jgi:hypothetical protein